MEQESMKLEPCPFCGDDEYWLRTVYYGYDDHGIGWLTDRHPDDTEVREMADEIMHCRVICLGCGGMMDTISPHDLARSWNRRANR